MTLKPNQICPYSSRCKYHGKVGSFCHGTNPSRKNSFDCAYVDDHGNFIEEGQNRSVHDITGKMEFIQD